PHQTIARHRRRSDVRRCHSCDARHPDVPARHDPLSAWKLLEFYSTGRPRNPQWNRKIDVIEVERAERVTSRVEPQDPCHFRQPANASRLELESGKTRLRTVAANRRVTMRFYELVRQNRRRVRGPVDVAVRALAATGRIELIPGDARYGAPRNPGALFRSLGDNREISIEHALVKIDVDRDEPLCFGRGASCQSLLHLDP